MKFRGRVAAPALLAMLLAAPVRAETVNRIVATIDGEPITAYELERYSRDHQGGEVPPAQILEALITDRLLEKEAAAKGISAKSDEIDKYVEQVKQRNKLTDEQFKQALTAQGLTLEVYRERVKGEIEKTQLVNREIRARVNISPEEIERHYKANLTEYETSGEVTVRDIFFAIPQGADAATVAAVRAKADEVRKQAADGKDFGKLAQQYSEGPGADKGGLIGTFKRGDLDAPLEKAVFSLKRKEVSEVVQTPRGFHVLEVDDVISGGHRSLDEVKDEIRNSLYDQALEKRFEDWLSKDLRERHHVEVLD